MFYYSYFSCQGRAVLADELNVTDPFALSPTDIVERVLMAGYKPAVDLPMTAPWSRVGIVYTVARDGQMFLVSVSRDPEVIGVQEARSDQYKRT